MTSSSPLRRSRVRHRCADMAEINTPLAIFATSVFFALKSYRKIGCYLRQKLVNDYGKLTEQLQSSVDQEIAMFNTAVMR